MEEEEGKKEKEKRSKKSKTLASLDMLTTLGTKVSIYIKDLALPQHPSPTISIPLALSYNSYYPILPLLHLP